jgi:hypothetical protein
VVKGEQSHKECRMPTNREEKLIQTRIDLTQRVFGDQPKLYNHAVLCSVGLPYRNPGDDVRVFQRASGNVSLRMEAGSMPRPGGGWEDVGLPYGSKSRLLLLHLCSEALFQKTPSLEVEHSFTSFARSIGLNTSGRSLKALRQQIQRMSVVSMRLSQTYGNTVDVFQGSLFSRFQAQTPDDPDQLTFWTTNIEFSPEFYLSLKNNAVPLSKDALMALKHNARAIDIYAWLAHRLWRVKPDKPISLKWTTLRFQFGERNQEMRSFKKRFNDALTQVLCVYPRARVEKIYGGLQLFHSPPPISPRRENRLIV